MVVWLPEVQQWYSKGCHVVRFQLKWQSHSSSQLSAIHVMSHKCRYWCSKLLVTVHNFSQGLQESFKLRQNVSVRDQQGSQVAFFDNGDRCSLHMVVQCGFQYSFARFDSIVPAVKHMDNRTLNFLRISLFCTCNDSHFQSELFTGVHICEWQSRRWRDLSEERAHGWVPTTP